MAECDAGAFSCFGHQAEPVDHLVPAVFRPGVFWKIKGKHAQISALKYVRDFQHVFQDVQMLFKASAVQRNLADGGADGPDGETVLLQHPQNLRGFAF